MSNKTNEPFSVIEGGRSEENVPGTPQYNAAQTQTFFEMFPNAAFEPAAVGRDLSLEERKRCLLWTADDVCNAFDDPDLLAYMLDLEDLDPDLQAVTDVALNCITDLHQYGRTTMPGLGIGVLKSVLAVIPAFESYFRKQNRKPRGSAVVQAEIERLQRMLVRLNKELQEAGKVDGKGQPPVG